MLSSGKKTFKVPVIPRETRWIDIGDERDGAEHSEDSTVACEDMFDELSLLSFNSSNVLSSTKISDYSATREDDTRASDLTRIKSTSMLGRGSAKSQHSIATGNFLNSDSPYNLRSKNPINLNPQHHGSSKNPAKLVSHDAEKGSQKSSKSKPSNPLPETVKSITSSALKTSDIESTKTPESIVVEPKATISDLKTSERLSQTTSTKIQNAEANSDPEQSSETFSPEPPTEAVSEINLPRSLRKNRETCSPYKLRNLMPVAYYGSPGSACSSGKEQHVRPRTSKGKRLGPSDDKPIEGKGKDLKETGVKTKNIGHEQENKAKELVDAFGKLSICDE